ncbi:MAG TPA: tail fiber protein [Terracidiphilus sp.]|nr:tail fiber protein [Terracidiphilus sp.]
MGTPYIAELKLVSFNFAPKGFATCNGQLLPINQNQALFSLVGTYYGGNGQTTFALPNLQGRTPISAGNGFVQGQVGGEEYHTLSAAEVPAHTHFASAMGTATVSNSGGNFLGGTSGQLTIYNTLANVVTLNPATVSTVGGNQPHSNLQPYLVMNWIISLQGIFPSRN